MTNTVIILPGEDHKIIKCDCPCHSEGCEHCLCSETNNQESNMNTLPEDKPFNSKEFFEQVKRVREVLDKDEKRYEEFMSAPIKLQPGEVAKIDQPESWEQRFDDRFSYGYENVTPYQHKQIKSFIRDLLADQRSKLLVDWFGDNYPNTIEKLK
jgi:hypothetical protein